jgi:hypothetical protein
LSQKANEIKQKITKLAPPAEQAAAEETTEASGINTVPDKQEQDQSDDMGEVALEQGSSGDREVEKLLEVQQDCAPADEQDSSVEYDAETLKSLAYFDIEFANDQLHSQGTKALGQNESIEEVPSQHASSTSSSGELPPIQFDEETLQNLAFYGYNHATGEFNNPPKLHRLVKEVLIEQEIFEKGQDQSNESAPTTQETDEVTAHDAQQALIEGPSAVLAEAPAPVEEKTKAGRLPRRGRKPVTMLPFDKTPPKQESPRPLPQERKKKKTKKTASELRKETLAGRHGYDAQLFEERLDGRDGEAMRACARETRKRQLREAEAEALLSYRQNPDPNKKPSRLVVIAQKTTMIAKCIDSWYASKPKDSLPESYLRVGQEIIDTYQETLRYDCPATLKAIRNFNNKWTAFCKMADSQNMLGKVSRHIEHLLKKWRNAKLDKQDRIHKHLHDKLACAVKHYHNFYDASREFATYTDLHPMMDIAADISKALVDNRIQLQTWYHQLKITMVELSSDVSTNPP